ncbi:c-type cytochrome [Reyranella sp.]|uniref:c-type cytochrome n=1 Tax=Reyranella sp. TaxID=1929291 RepID=UPI004035019A
MRYLPAVAVGFMAVTSLTAATSPGQAADGDVAKGAQIYQRCLACHSLEYNRSGPRHCGLFGRAAGSLPGFDYSKAMKATGIVWDEPTLDRFLENPLKTVPGTKMAYAGVKNEQERTDLIAYLKHATRDLAKCP